VRRLWVWVLGAVVAFGLASSAGSADAHGLGPHHARHHRVARSRLVASRPLRALPAPRPAPPSRDRSTNRAAVPRLAHSSHHRSGPRPWDNHALGTPSYDPRQQDASERIARTSGWVISFQEHPVISGRGPPSPLQFRLSSHPVAPTSEIPILRSTSPNPTAVGPSRDPDAVSFARVLPPDGRPARFVAFRFGHKGPSHELCRLASRPKGAASGHVQPFVGGIA
jgi:hypothetical protein